jgi:hypothetical protein
MSGGGGRSGGGSGGGSSQQLQTWQWCTIIKYDLSFACNYSSECLILSHDVYSSFYGG